MNTKRYSKIIEPIFDKILINHHGDNWNFFWKNASNLTKIHFFYILLLPVWYFLIVQLAFEEENMSAVFFIALGPLIAVVIMFMGIMIITNIAFYYTTISVLQVFKFESGVLNKNVTALESVTDSIKFYKHSAIILGASGIFGSGLMGKAGGMKGLGGGKFGGSGAGGAW